MNPSPNKEYEAFRRRLDKLPQGSNREFTGTLFRFVNPSYCSPKNAIDGRGSLKSPGRWHPYGKHPCLYVATTPETALQEALSEKRYYNLPDHKSLPRVLIGIHAKLLYLLDLNDGRIRNRLRLSQRRILDCDWRDDNDFNHTESLTQTMGRAAYNKGFEGLIVPSQANQPNGTNLVIFCDKLLRPNSLTPETP